MPPGRSMSGNASTATASNPARAADAAAARIETPASTTRDIGARLLLGGRERSRDVGDRLGVEHRVVLLEEARDAGLVHLHLQPSNAERTEDDHAVALDAAVHHLDALDPERRHGVEVGGDT